MSSKKNSMVVPHMQMVSVADLSPDKEPFTVVVRVLRKWEVYTARGGDTQNRYQKKHICI